MKRKWEENFVRSDIFSYKFIRFETARFLNHVSITVDVLHVHLAHTSRTCISSFLRLWEQKEESGTKYRKSFNFMNWWKIFDNFSFFFRQHNFFDEVLSSHFLLTFMHKIHVIHFQISLENSLIWFKISPFFLILKIFIFDFLVNFLKFFLKIFLKYFS